MTVNVTFELKMQDGKTEEMISIAREAFRTTRQYDGCKQIDKSVGKCYGQIYGLRFLQGF